MNKINTGDLMFSSADDMIGHIVAYISQSYVTHCGIFVWIIQDSCEIIESYQEGASLCVFHITKKRFYDVLSKEKKNGAILEEISSVKERFQNIYLRRCNVKNINR